MEKYISKSALVAEIRKRLLPVIRDKHYDEWEEGQDSERIAILGIIDALEVKEVDLEEEIKNRIDSLSNLYCYMEDLFNGTEEEGVHPIPEEVTNELFEFAKHFFELGMAVSNKDEK